jgi:Carboxylesterase family/Beta-lactamase
LDAVAALQWIQNNISNFGGDPKRVTIGGQSAGSSVVHDLTASPLAKGLFWAAIAESGSGVSSPIATRTLQEAELDGQAYAKLKGVSSLAELRRLPAEQFIPVTAVPGSARVGRMSPNIDGWFLPAGVSQIFAEGGQNDVAILTGMQADEGSSAPTYGKLTSDEVKQQAETRYETMEPEFLRLYPTDYGNLADSQKASARDRGLISMLLWASDTSKTNRNKIYTYYFSRGIPWPEFAAFHTSELIYDFDNLSKLERPFTAGDKALSNLMASYWVNFIKTRNPNGAGLPVWQPFSAGYATALHEHGYVLLGMVIEKVSGLSYAEFLQKNIFDPLGMKDSGYDRQSTILPQRASGYMRKDHHIENADFIDMSIPNAAGSVYSTVEDMYRWNEAVANGKLLSAASIEAMFKVYSETLLQGQHYGYGVVLAERFGKTLYYHGGGVKGFETVLQRYPKEHVSIVVMENLDPTAPWNVGDQIASCLFHQPVPASH